MRPYAVYEKGRAESGLSESNALCLSADHAEVHYLQSSLEFGWRKASILPWDRDSISALLYCSPLFCNQMEHEMNSATLQGEMLPKIFVTLGVLVYGVVVPFLEINTSHVLNDAWPPHARLHEVWQLTTNSSIGVLALWLVWAKGEVFIASILNIVVMGGVLVAYVLEEAYGGSIVTGNVTKTVFGLDLAAFAAGLVVGLAVAALSLATRRSAIS